mgnify:FL=1
MWLVLTLSFCRSKSVVSGKISPLNLGENKSHSFGVISSTPATLHTTATIKVCCAPEQKNKGSVETYVHWIFKRANLLPFGLTLDIILLFQEKHQTNFNLRTVPTN